jgi:predicted anti-sigma-YlaC factor YlaD
MGRDAMRTADDLACKEFVELVTEYLEGALAADVRARFEAHLEVCSGCRLYLGQMRLTIRGLHEPRNGALPPRMRETSHGALDTAAALLR